jgi:hypothetical protein
VLSLACPVRAAELHWDVPEACPDVHALELESEQVLGEPLAKYPLNVTGTVTPSEDQLMLSLRITLPANAETRERELRAVSCQELLEAAAVAIALAAAESGERSPDVPQTRDLSEPQPRAASVLEEETDQASVIALSAAGAGTWGALPSVGLGGELQVAWLRRWLRIGLGATWFPLRGMQLTDNVQASFGLYFIELLLCGQQSLGRALFFGCTTAHIGRMDAHLVAPGVGPTESAAWRALGVRIGASYPIAPPLELTASFAAVMPLTRPRFYSQPTGAAEIHEPAAVATRLLIGILFSL